MNRPDDPTIECASLPAAMLSRLAGLRREPGVTVVAAGDRAWVRWPPLATAVLDAVRPLPGAGLYARRGGLWYRLGHRLPAFDVPDREAGVPLRRALTPQAARPVEPADGPVLPAALRLVRDDRPRTASALACPLDLLGRWIDLAPTARWSGLQAARAGDRVLIRGRGRPLPPLAGVERYWGDRVLAPLGVRPEPALPESAILAAVGAGDEAIVLLSDDAAEVVPLRAFRPLTRAGVRLALGGTWS